MDSKLEILLKKLNIEQDKYKYFENGKLIKIVGNKEKTNYNFYIELNTNIPYEILEELNIKIKKIYSEFKEVKIILNVINIDTNLLKEYYIKLIEKYSKKSPLIGSFKDSKIEYNDSLKIYVHNKAEEMKLDSIKENLEKDFKEAGFNLNINIIIDDVHDNEILEEIKKDLDVSNIEIPEVKQPEPKEEKKRFIPNKDYERPPLIVEKDNEDVIMGRVIDSEITRLDSIYEQNKLFTLEAKLFQDVDVLETKTGLKILTLKITDLTDSIYGKIFVNDDEEFKAIISKLKKGKWYKFRGNTKDDKYSNELTLQIKDINTSNYKEPEIIDDAPVKRVELHAHTMMSGMDGITNLDLGKHTCELVEKTMKMGYRGVAITDHSGCQAFPVSFGIIKSYNKGIRKKIK